MREFSGNWSFAEKIEEYTEVIFQIKYYFKSSTLAVLFHLFKEIVSNKIMDAFEKRMIYINYHKNLAGH